MYESNRRGFGRSSAIVILVILASAGSSRAEDISTRKIPVMEIGVVLPVTYREERINSAGTMDPTENSFALAMRLDVSVLGILLPILDVRTGKFRVGDMLGIDLGITKGGEFAGRVLFGAQVNYELSDNVGLGVRAYWLNQFEELLPGAFGSHHMGFKIGEVSARFGGVIARARMSLTPAADDGHKLSDFGVSVRIPTGLQLAGYKGWMVGLDYDRFALVDPVGPEGDYTIHSVTAVLAVGY